ncbi:hypothetical protein OKS_03059 [Enterococcus faecium EnGen0047]|nr:hypothetical protein OKS_03059 [Enterococcus faecium EnGen0047]OTO89665.1 MerR family transcriptional regulator [Enterococcus sp. 10F3_DIV0382]
MHKGTEIDFVLNDSLKALKLYQTIFDEIELIEATEYPRGNNEVIFPCMARGSICWMTIRPLV